MFKRDVVRVARRGDLSQTEVAANFDISVESVRRWVRQADIEDGVVDGRTSAEQNKLVQLCREKRRLEMGNEFLSRAAATPGCLLRCANPILRTPTSPTPSSTQTPMTRSSATDC
ncbi:helix-turn-helix domain-containing protein [Blastococcus sp. TF02-9]|uniref:helix-turn-helix domain-containing protein n=1 Tax=Blastococcus sp. TF02-09 TaxID=2250576 RepID=UPI0013145C04|nr:helix-turn-helix domain-containing protein [Blastococcus sp. TF02-9]